MPALPGPKSLEWGKTDLVDASTNPFTGIEQIYDWGASFLTATITLPPLGDATTAAAWVSFLLSLRGKATCFALPTGWAALIPSVTMSGYFSLAANTTKYSVSDAMLYGINLDIREVVAT